MIHVHYTEIDAEFIHLTEGSVDAELGGVQGSGDLSAANYGKLARESLLHGSRENTASGVRLNLDGGVSIALVDGGKDSTNLVLLAIRQLTSQGDILGGSVREKSRESRKVLVSTSTKEEHLRSSVSNAKTDIVRLDGGLRKLHLGIGTHGDGTVTTDSGGLNTAEVDQIELAGNSGGRGSVCEGQIRLVAVVALELKLQARGGTNEGGLDGKLAISAGLKLLEGEASVVGPLETELRGELGVFRVEGGGSGQCLIYYC